MTRPDAQAAAGRMSVVMTCYNYGRYLVRTR